MLRDLQISSFTLSKRDALFWTGVQCSEWFQKLSVACIFNRMRVQGFPLRCEASLLNRKQRDESIWLKTVVEISSVKKCSPFWGWIINTAACLTPLTEWVYKQMRLQNSSLLTSISTTVVEPPPTMLPMN